MREKISVLLFLAVLISISFISLLVKSATNHTKEETIMKNVPDVWVTTVDQKYLLKKVTLNEFSKNIDVTGLTPKVIEIDTSRKYQEIDGFGASFTDSSAYLVYKVLEPEQRREVMKKLFSYDEGIGISFLRQPIGASDYALTMYSYNDLPEGITEDPELKFFSIEHDRDYILPALKDALEINPLLKVMASPWSAPGWMKTSGIMIGGSLLPYMYEVYAKYLVKFIKAYESEGVPIYAITVQNEPLYVPKDYPGMRMSADEQARLIKNYLGPLLEKEGIKTKILIYDHNWDNTAFTMQILSDPEASKYVAGSAWHCYAGKHSAMSYIKELFPDKDIWFTEASGGDWVPAFFDAFMDQMMHVIRSIRNWSRTVVWWNITLDEGNGPALFSNVRKSTCRGLIKVDKRTKKVAYNVDYYTLGHVSKFVKPGARRIWSTSFENDLESVAFENKDGSIVVVVSNRTNAYKKVKINNFEFVLPGFAGATFVWKTFE